MKRFLALGLLVVSSTIAVANAADHGHHKATVHSDNPVLRATCRTLCVPWSQRHLKIRTLLAQNVMSVSALKGD